ncbi:MAG: flagellar motor switch phosphatase FliY, partial [Schwartzia sp.]|nr:flagellar motor switch phosphatase FliY [Schwartzia sp. (in: firmicutes)]
MSDDMISQEEIDALLNGGGAAPPADSAPAADAAEPAADGAAAPDLGSPLSDMEKDALGEIGNISMGSAATTLSVLLGHKVSITTPTVSVDTMNSIRNTYPLPYLIVEVGYTIGIDGNNILAIQAQDACIIADLMMGGDGTNPPEDLNEIHMSAVGEAMNQMMGSVSTSLSTMFNKKIDISPPKVNLIDLGSEDKVTEIVGGDDVVAKISFRMEVDGLIDSQIMQILPLGIAREMVESLMNSSKAEEEVAAPPPAPAPAPAAPPPPPAAPAAPPPMAAAPPPMAPAPQAAPMMQAPMPSYGQAIAQG